MKMKDLCCDEQPREKMLAKGAASLSNAELLAILLRTGDGTFNAVEICRGLLKQAGESLCDLSDWSVDRLQDISGIGPAKALTIGAAFELARRWFTEKSGVPGGPVNRSTDAFRAIMPRLKDLSHEESWIIMLNRSNKVIGTEKLSSGGLTQTTMDSRVIVRRVLEKHATAVILVHNHPSGNPRPGKADMECTEMLRAALSAFDVALLDHIVVCNDCWYSFSEERVYGIKAPCADGQ